MDTRDSDLLDQNSQKVASDSPGSPTRKVPRRPQNNGWVQNERRLPENAKIRRWMDLGDKALRDGDDEEPNSK